MNTRPLLAVLFAVALGWLAYAQVAERPSPARMSLADFKKAVDAGQVVAIDVRDSDSYAAGHIPGARSIPLDTVAARAAELKGAGKPIVAYCA